MTQEPAATRRVLGFGARHLVAAGLAILALAAGGIGQAHAQDQRDLFCVRVSDEVAANRLNRQVVRERVMIRVVPASECGTDAALDALSDVEHFGISRLPRLSMAISAIAR